MRLFFAVPVSGPVREIVSERIRRFPVSDPPWRWIDPGNYHLTMKFLGEVEEDRIPGLCEAARLAVSGVEPFRIAFGPFGGFPAVSRPRVLFFGITEGADRLAALAVKLEDELQKMGFGRERKPFRAHLTLARIKFIRDHESLGDLLREYSETVFQQDRIEELIYYESILRPEGPEYIPLRKASFKIP